ncbi:MAG: tetratricopeptide repeat protein, partial [Myxococcales bacterium]|nr:tetratricopeptide repeat protein [Myxococcales bacterium]
DNVMIGDDGRVRVMDFGLARSPGELSAAGDVTLESDGPPSSSAESTDTRLLSQPLTRTGTLLGTPAYMSPEQCAGRPTDARSDQFSFCVSLFEALYKQRPFPCTSIAERLHAIETGTVAAVTHAGVPSRLHRALLRGLARAPEDRWPSMDALLAALSDEPEKRWRRRAAGALATAVVGGGALTLALTLSSAAGQVCAGMEKHVQEVWGPDQRAEVRAAIERTGLSYAAETWSRIEGGLDDYTERWVAARVDACEATHSGEQSERLLDLRMTCLDEHLGQVQATVQLLREADADAVEHAADALAKLPALDRCADAAALSAEVPPPADPEVARRVAELTSMFVDAEVLARVTKYSEALELVGAVASEASALDYAPLELRARLLEGELQRQTGEHALAEATFERAYDGALRRGMIPEAARAAIEITVLLGTNLARPEDSAGWARHAELLSEADGREVAQSRFLRYRGLVSTAQGDYAAAYADYERALAMSERMYGPDHPAVATALNNLGNACQKLGRFDEALGYNERALVIDERTHGPGHPFTATSLFNLGTVAKAKGDLDAAARFHERALAIRERALG